MSREYDVIALGSGSAGYTVASKCREAGRSVALVEAREFGGTCPLRGCNPKKVLVNAAEVVGKGSDLKGKGIQAPSEIRWPDLIRFKRTLIDPMPGIVKKKLEKNQVDMFHGKARFLGKNRLQVGDKTLVGQYFFIGTGAVPRPLNIPGEEHIVTSEGFLDLEHLPASIIFIGGGYISFEFAQVAALAGSKAIILQRSEHPLKKFDQEVVARLLDLIRHLGIEVQVNMPVRAVEKTGQQLVVKAGQDGEQEFKADLVVHGAGRVPNIMDLNLEKVGVEATSRGITVNDYLQSVSNPLVYAGGDAAATPYPLTPTAYLHGKIAAQNILEGNTVKVDHTGIPSVVFTVPPLASVGLREVEIEEQGLSYHKIFQDTSRWFSSKSIGLREAWAKILIDNDSGIILGAHLLANHAEEMINVFALAMRLGLTVNDLQKVIWAYPTSISDIAYLLSLWCPSCSLE
jgi:glutathione reductase (NADPH)